LTFGVAWLACRPIRRAATNWVERVPEHHHLDWIVSHRSWVTERLVPLIMPMAWAIGLWLSVTVAERAGWPHAVTQTAVSLLLAWLVIRLAAALVPYAALARLIAVLAWLVAALNIVHLLGPTLDFLDSLAIVVGGLRVSILTVVKGVFSLVMLLWGCHHGVQPFRPVQKQNDAAKQVGYSALQPKSDANSDLSAPVNSAKVLGSTPTLVSENTTAKVSRVVLISLPSSTRARGNLGNAGDAAFDKAGDVIEAGGTYGWVSSLGARYVSVETRDGTEFLIPNEDIITHQVVNWSHRSDRVRLKVPVRVPHDSDLDLALVLMREAASYPERVLAAPAPNALIMAFGETAIELELRFWIEDAQNGVHNVKSEVLYEIWRLFRREGIQIPYPKRDLYVRSDAPARLS
jgi:Mechanosensitive ion channel